MLDSFQMANRTWQTKWVSNEELRKLSKTEDPDEEVVGLCRHEEAVIYLNLDIRKFPAEYQEHCFWHEFVHAMMFSDGSQQHDEAEMDRWGGYLQQALGEYL